MRGSRGSAWAGREASHSGSDASTRIRDRALFLPSPSPASFLFPVPSSFLRCVAIGAERPCPANWGGLSMFASSAAFSFGGGPLRCLGAQRGIILRLICKAAIGNRACHGFGALALVPFVLPPSLLLLLRLVFCSTRACATLGCAADRPRGRDNICLLLGAEVRDIVSSLLPPPLSLRTATPQAEGGCIADFGTLPFSLIIPPPLVCVFKAYVCVAAPFFPLALPPAWCPASLTLNLCRRCREAVGLDLASPQQG